MLTEKSGCKFPEDTKEYTLFFIKQQFYKQRQAEIGKKSSKC